MHPIQTVNTAQFPVRAAAKPWLVIAGVMLITLAALISGYPTACLEILFVALIARQLRRHPALYKSPTRVLLVCALYASAGLVSATPSSLDELKDFAVIYKSLYYLAGLSLIASRSWIGYELGVWVFRAFLWLFFVGYSYGRFLAGTERPTIFIENNYELIPLILCAVALVARGKKPAMHEWAALLYVCALSGSKSSIAALAVALFAMVRLHLSIKAIFQWAALGVAVAVVIYLLALRVGAGGIESIDRVIFLNAFLDETHNWSVIEWLFGAPAMTPLSSGTCQSLAYYEVLMSYTGSGSCYSVILHSFVLRVIFDHGIVGLILSLYAVNYLLRRRRYAIRSRATVLLIIVATGLSVSSLNNAYVALGLLFMLALQPPALLRRQFESIGATCIGRPSAP